MPNFLKGKYTESKNFENYKSTLNEAYSKTLLYDFYMNYFTQSKNEDKKKLIQMHPLITKNIFRLSNDFILATNRSKTASSKNEQAIKNSELSIDFDTILYKGLFPLDISAKNFLYLKLLKFHFGIMQFFDLYAKYNFEKLHVDEILMNDYLNKKFIVCLNAKKSELRNKADEYTDFQLISQVCVKERLTLYNFLNEEMNLKKDDVKRYINNQYINVFRQKGNRGADVWKSVKKDFDFSKEVDNKNVEDFIRPYSK